MDNSLSILAGVDWNEVLKTIGSTAVVVAILGFLARSTIKYFLDRDVAKHKTDLEQQTAEFKSNLESRTARVERIRQEVMRWANPIFGSVTALERRLDNILRREGFPALSPTTRFDSDWSITYDYFLPSTVYLLAQYFCWVHLLEERLSFELFEEHADKDRLRDKIYAVNRTLASFRYEEELKGPSGGDRQVFNMQQRALGEMMAVNDSSGPRCMSYSEFLTKWNEPEFSRRFDPLTNFIDRLEPNNFHRWRRLELMASALRELHVECERLLKIRTG